MKADSYSSQKDSMLQQYAFKFKFKPSIMLLYLASMQLQENLMLANDESVLLKKKAESKSSYKRQRLRRWW